MICFPLLMCERFWEKRDWCVLNIYECILSAVILRHLTSFCSHLLAINIKQVSLLTFSFQLWSLAGDVTIWQSWIRLVLN